MDGISLLPHDGIAHRVLELLKGAREHATLVTPYFQPWRHLRDAVLDAASRGTSITLIVRSDQVEKTASTLAHFADAGLELRQLERLHAKVYATDSAAIVTSMNLLETSALNSWEAGVHVSARGAGELFAGIVDQIEAMRAKSEAIHLPGAKPSDGERRRGPEDRRRSRTPEAALDPEMKRRLAELSVLKLEADLSPGMIETRKKHPRAYEAWSPDEDAILTALRHGGRSFEEIAVHLERQTSAIRSRANGVLGMRESGESRLTDGAAGGPGARRAARRRSPGPSAGT
jgi:hypothetical protein